MILEDATAAHKIAHAKCADVSTRCDCAYCEDGKCAEDDVYLVHEGVTGRVLCGKGDAADFSYACVKGTCAKGCGWFEKVPVARLERKVANKVR